MPHNAEELEIIRRDKSLGETIIFRKKKMTRKDALHIIYDERDKAMSKIQQAHNKKLVDMFNLPKVEKKIAKS